MVISIHYQLALRLTYGPLGAPPHLSLRALGVLALLRGGLPLAKADDEPSDLGDPPEYPLYIEMIRYGGNEVIFLFLPFHLLIPLYRVDPVLTNAAVLVG